MDQHPVPQPIAGYEFRLVGDMTLKQFLKLASGVILALIVYAVNPPTLIKWFLMLLFGGLGFAMAFVPFEGRPVDLWIIAFFKRIYSPTLYLWRPRKDKTQAISSVTNPAPQAPVNNPSATVTPPQPSIPTASPNQPIYQANPAPSGAYTPKPMPKTIFKGSNIYIPPPEIQVKNIKRVEAKFTPGVVIPSAPTIPNILVGFIHNKENKIIEGAILEIRDSYGTPVRAFKSNKLGQFQSATPLPNGLYEIETEKEGFEFDIIKIELKGQIIQPIEIVSK
ncbi:MAG: hypothetical protein M1514_03075 [Patescibacteria group bacterium]|nr:hypothetical protein [Patescibacteria group bacterium]